MKTRESPSKSRASISTAISGPLNTTIAGAAINGNIKGYENYAAEASAIQDVGIDAAADAVIGRATWRTPTQVIEKIQGRRDAMGDYLVMLSPAWGGLSFDLAHDSMQLVSDTVLPEHRAIGG